MTTAKLLKNARSPRWDSPRDILIEGGRIAQIGKDLKDGTAAVLDLEGRIVIPGLVEGHTHLDKALTLALCENKEGTLIGAIREMAKLKRKASVEDFYQRAEACLQKFISNGATTVRTHVDVDSSSDLRGMEALIKLREAYRDRVSLQLVAFPSGASGPLGDSQNKDRLTAAVEMGADVVGGSPSLAEDPKEHINVAFGLAMKRDLPVDMHIDESDNPADRALEILAEKTMAEGYQGRVVAGHCCSLAAMDDAAAGRIIEKVAEACISVITMPFCNLYLQGRHDAQPIRRGLTRVKELDSAGVNVYCASDNVQDPFGPFGRADTLEAAWLTGLAAQLDPSSMAKILDMVTIRPARAVRLGETYGVTAGGVADLVVMAAESVETAVIERPERVLVFQGGRIVSTGPGAAALGVTAAEI